MAVQRLISLEPYPFHLAGIWNPWVHWLPGQRASSAASSPWRARWCPWGTVASWTRSRLGGEHRLGRRSLWPPSCPGQTWLLCHLGHEKQMMLVKLENWKLAAGKRRAKRGAWLRIQVQSKWLNFKGTRGAEILKAVPPSYKTKPLWAVCWRVSAPQQENGHGICPFGKKGEEKT